MSSNFQAKTESRLSSFSTANCSAKENQQNWVQNSIFSGHLKCAGLIVCHLYLSSTSVISSKCKKDKKTSRSLLSYGIFPGFRSELYRNISLLHWGTTKEVERALKEWIEICLKIRTVLGSLVCHFLFGRQLSQSTAETWYVESCEIDNSQVWLRLHVHQPLHQHHHQTVNPDVPACLQHLFCQNVAHYLFDVEDLLRPRRNQHFYGSS